MTTPVSHPHHVCCFPRRSTVTRVPSWFLLLEARTIKPLNSVGWYFSKPWWVFDDIELAVKSLLETSQWNTQGLQMALLKRPINFLLQTHCIQSCHPARPYFFGTKHCYSPLASCSCLTSTFSHHDSDFSLGFSLNYTLISEFQSPGNSTPTTVPLDAAFQRLDFHNE